MRQFAQDDCHVFLREDQIADEVKFLMDFILGYYAAFGLDGHAQVRDASREPDRRRRAVGPRRGGAARRARGDGAAVRAQGRATARSTGRRSTSTSPTRIGRAWQLGTIQLDYNAPERFDLTYVGEDNAEHRPVVIHRAVSGSFERFIAILIEHFAGAFPVWLAPEQVRVLPITDDQAEAARGGSRERIVAAGIRAHLDDRSETLKYRIREGADEGAVHGGGRAARGGERQPGAPRARARARSRRSCPWRRSSPGSWRKSRTRALVP